MSRLKISLGLIAVVALGLGACATDRTGLTGGKSGSSSNNFENEITAKEFVDVEGYKIDSAFVEKLVDFNLDGGLLENELRKNAAGPSANPWLIRVFATPGQVDRAALRANIGTQLLTLATLHSRSLAMGVKVEPADRDDATQEELEVISSFFAPTTGRDPDAAPVDDGSGQPTTTLSRDQQVTFEDLPRELQEIVRDETARVRANNRFLAEAGKDAPQRLADSFGERLKTKYCFRHILVSNEERGDEAALQLAKDLRVQIVGGADFATIAIASSDDPGSASNGGSYGCQSDLALAGYVGEFAAGIRSATVGEVTEPVKTQFGYHLIKVDSLEQQTPEELATEIETNFAGSLPANGDTLFAYAGWALKIAQPITTYRVDPEFGTTEFASGSQVVIIPPGVTRDELFATASIG